MFAHFRSILRLAKDYRKTKVYYIMNNDKYRCENVIGRVRKIAVKKGRPSTSLLITGRSQVHTCAGSSESDHSGN